MKDHEVAALVNRLTQIAKEFSGTQQLRERIAREIRPLSQRQWVGLTDEERVEMWKNYNPLHGMSEFIRSIEAKLKEKNNG